MFDWVSQVLLWQAFVSAGLQQLPPEQHTLSALSHKSPAWQSPLSPM
jgi:hypothetical protein